MPSIGAVSFGPEPVSPLLTPTTLLGLLLVTCPFAHEQFVTGGWSEYRLSGLPRSLKAFADLFLRDDGTYDQRRCIRVPGGSYVCISALGQPKDFLVTNPLKTARPYQESQYTIVVPRLEFQFWSASAVEATDCLKFLLVDLSNKDFDRVELRSNVKFIFPSLCPLSNSQLQLLLKHRDGKAILFHKTTFTPDQCTALVTGGTKSVIELSECEFLDRGTAFLKELENPREQGGGLSDLIVDNSSLFELAQWKQFLKLLCDQDCLRSLSLKEQYLSEEEVSLLAATQLDRLELESCTMENGTALITMLEKNTGPKNLCLSDAPMFEMRTALDWWHSFAMVLKRNRHLEGFTLAQPALDGIPSLLIDALRHNTFIQNFGLRFVEMETEQWNELMEIVSSHPSLRSLELAEISAPEHTEGCWTELYDQEDQERRCRTKSMANALMLNSGVKNVEFDSGTFERDEWDKHVSPQLKLNQYQERFASLETVSKCRSALLGSAIANVSSAPSLVNVLLSKNVDTFVSTLGKRRCPAETGAPAKRRRRTTITRSVKM